MEESAPEPSAATVNHKRGISDVTTRSEREQQHEQERPATRRGGRRINASKLERLGIKGGEEAREPLNMVGYREFFPKTIFQKSRSLSKMHIYEMHTCTPVRDIGL